MHRDMNSTIFGNRPVGSPVCNMNPLMFLNKEYIIAQIELMNAIIKFPSLFREVHWGKQF